MEYFTPTKRPKKQMEKNSGELRVEQSGYVPSKLRIEQFIDAGKRLVAYRKEQFDFPEGEIDENFYDPTRRLDYDLADASQDAMRVKNRIDDQVEEQKALEAEKKALEAEKQAIIDAENKIILDNHKKNKDKKE